MTKLSISACKAHAPSPLGIGLAWESVLIPGTRGKSIAYVFAMREALGLRKQDLLTPITMKDLVHMSLGHAISDGHANAPSALGVRLRWSDAVIPGTKGISIASVFAQWKQ